jgi:tRNA pseudouridine32 synthase / 23S rRNA pseudouridine746 synthase
MATQHYSFHCTPENAKVSGDDGLTALTALAALASICPLSKQRLKDALGKGAIWLKRGKHNKRLRRATTELRAGDVLELHYNADILALTPPAPSLQADEKHYSVWNKPAGLLAQGTLEGDHCSLLRLAEQQLQRESFLVHRLDREASGLMLIAHDNSNDLQKHYRIEVRGQTPATGELTSPLDGKHALTRYRTLSVDAARNSSVVEVQLITGRKHQIRRHFDMLGHPVLGDPSYGSNNQDVRGLQLQATGLAFTCPLTKQARHYRLL